jgi:hypothetical protein
MFLCFDFAYSRHSVIAAKNEPHCVCTICMYHIYVDIFKRSSQFTYKYNLLQEQFVSREGNEVFLFLKS